jgi:hypothetical protein
MLHYKLIRLAAIPLVMIMSASTARAGVIAWYPLHGDASAIVGNDGVLVNAPTPAPDEKSNANGALSFAALPTNSPNYSGSNSGSYVSVDGGAGLPGLQQGTIALWVNWSGMQGTGWTGGGVTNYGSVIARQSNGKYSDNVLGISAADPNLGTLTWRPYDAGVPPVALGATPVGDNVWHFVAVTFDFTTGEHDVYLDGNLDGQGFFIPASGTLHTDTNAPLTIGAWIGDGATYSNSTINSVFIFDTVLSQTDIQNLQATGVPYRHP